MGLVERHGHTYRTSWHLEKRGMRGGCVERRMCWVEDVLMGGCIG